MVLAVIRSRPELELALTADDVERIHRAGRIASLIGVEGGHMIEESLAALRIFHKLGARYMTLTHWDNVQWADAATDRTEHDGLTEFGESVVREMNRLGMFVDLSHVSPDTMRDALRVSRAPVIFSHSNAAAITPHPRNVPDDVLRLLPKNGGVVHVNFIKEFVSPGDPAWQKRRTAALEDLRSRLDDQKAVDAGIAAWEKANPHPGGTIAEVADHIDHIRKVAGIDHVGIGADFYDAASDVHGHRSGATSLATHICSRSSSDAATAKRTCSRSRGATTCARCDRWRRRPSDGSHALSHSASARAARRLHLRCRCAHACRSRRRVRAAG